MYPDAEQIILVMDNLNSHKASSLYKTVDFHYTPKHGSWLDIAEIKLNVMTRQCLFRRIDAIEPLRDELSAWENERNRSHAGVNWQFHTRNVRIKLVSLYPDI